METADQPVEHIRPSRSTKPLPVKMEVVSLYTLGYSKRKIAKALNIQVITVGKILKESNICSSDSVAAKYGIQSLMLDSVSGVSHHVSKKNLKACMYVLDNTIYKEESGNRQFNANVQVNVNIPRPKFEADPPTIEAKTVAELPESTNSGTDTK